jgi:DNA-binding SARP family transcriptional activator/tetratricopeptide (TPR) repeat protein
MAEFRLLGAVEAYAPAGAVDVGPPRQRTVLAALLIDAGHVVPVDVLVDRIWGDDPPDLARRSLHSYIARLRRVVQALSTPEQKLELVRRSGGYQLLVPPQRVDVLRFRALVEQARDAARPDAERAALLRDALALWRGEPLAGASGDWAARLRELLAQQRADAAVAWAEVEMRIGNAAALIGPLGELAAAYPLVEPLAARYVLALHAAGRSAQALRHFEAVRRELAETLGVDPTAQLRQAHQTVLRADPAAPATHPNTSPAMLPPDLHGFTGRTAELAELDRLTGEPRRAVAIAALSGPAGVGKTALAVHWAHRAADRYPDGQLYVNLRGFDPSGEALTPQQAVRILLDALGVPAQRIPADPDAQVGLYRSELAGRRVLLLLDNARDAAQVRPLLPGSPSSTVLVTSRNLLTGLVAAESAHPLAVPLPTLPDAIALVAARLGQTRVAAEAGAVRTIVERCGRLPLALAVAAARAATHPDLPLSALAAELAGDAGLDALSGEDPSTDPRTVFGSSYRALSVPARRLFRLLAAHPGPDIPTPAAASLAALPVARTRPLLTELRTASLLTEQEPDRYVLHDLLRAYAIELSATGAADHVEAAGVLAAQRAATLRLLDHYLRTAEPAARRLNPQRDPIPLPEPVPGVTVEPPAEPLDWFGREWPALVAAVQLAANTGAETYAWQLASSLFTFLDGQGRWLEVVACLQTAIAAAGRIGARDAQLRAYRLLGLTYLRLGRYDAAHAELNRALDLAAELGDHMSRARCEDVVAVLYSREGDHRAALDPQRAAMEQYGLARHPAGQASALNGMGWSYAHLGEHSLALSYCEQALEIQQGLGDRPSAADSWDSVGYVKHLLGDHAGARAAYREALAIYRDIGDRNLEAETLTRLGDTDEAAGDLAAAGRSWRAAAAILDDLDRVDPDLRARLANLDRQSTG